MNDRNAGPVVLLTALSVEYQAIRTHLAGCERRSHPTGTIFEVGRAPGGTEVAISEFGEGNIRAAVLAERAISMFNPLALIFVGVAGTLKERVNLGDVVVATKVYGYENGSYVDGAHRARPDAWEPHHKAEQLARHVAETRAWVKYLGLAEGTDPPKVHFEPVASGGQILNSPEAPLAELLRLFYNDAAAIEMEGAGVSQAGHLNNSCPVIIIRAVSDRADGSKDSTDRGGWQRVAAANAAAFALGLAEALDTYRLGEASEADRAAAGQPGAALVQENNASGFSTVMAAQGGSVYVSGVPGRGHADRLEALATASADALMAAVATDSWSAVRDSFAQVFAGADATGYANIGAQLESNASLLCDLPGAESARTVLRMWKLEFAKLLRAHPATSAELDALIERQDGASASPGSPRPMNQKNTASDFGVVLAAQDGNVIHH